MKPLIYAHRGMSSVCPENTLPAFEACAGTGTDGVELDVQMTADGQLVVAHDEGLARVAGVPGMIRDMRWEDLLRLDAGRWFSPSFAGERIPLLEDVLKLCRRSNLRVNIELKTNVFTYAGIEEKTAALVRRLDMADGVMVSSFNHETLMRFRRVMPEVPCGILYLERMVRPHRYAMELEMEALHPEYSATRPGMLEEAAAAGILVNVWFWQERMDPLRFQEVLASGVNTVITNYPLEYLELASGK